MPVGEPFAESLSNFISTALKNNLFSASEMHCLSLLQSGSDCAVLAHLRSDPRQDDNGLQAIFIEEAPPDLFRFATADKNGIGSHGERIGDSSRHDPWAFFLIAKSPRLPEEAVGVATKTLIFIGKSSTGNLWKMPMNGHEERRVLPAVAMRGFSVVNEGFYHISPER